MRAIIFGAGPIEDYDAIKSALSHNGDVVICCDGGMVHTYKLMMQPDFVLGDFDSVPPEILQFYKQIGISMVEFPAMKDFTDLELGIDFALGLNPEEIIIFGATGGRFDHMFANVELLMKPLSKGIPASLEDELHSIRLLKDAIEFSGKPGDIVSLLPISQEVKGINTKNLSYALTDGEMHFGQSLGVSNVMTDLTASVTIQSGLLLAIYIKKPC